jgi:hypothetical protein
MALIFEPTALRELFGEPFNRVSTLQIDVTVKESHRLPSTVTEKPVEDGSVISDTVVLQNAKLAISGIFVDDRAGKSWGEKWQALQEIRRQRQPFSVVTSLGVYENMIFTNISTDRDVATAGALFFDADLIQIRIISGQSVRVPVAAVSNPPSQAPKQDAGKVQPKELTEGEAAAVTESQSESLLYGIFN